MGLVAVWCQFAQTIFYYPALLAYVGSTLAYIIDPTLASNGIYTAAIIVILFWSGVLVSSRGVGFVAKLSSSGTVIGTLIPGAVLVVLAVVLPGPGQSIRGADDRPPRAAGVERAREHRPGGQQFFHLRGHRGQCRAC